MLGHFGATLRHVWERTLDPYSVDLPRFFLVEFLVELRCGEGLDERLVFPLDFACTDEPPLPPLLLDRFLPAQPLREEFLKLRDSETKRLLRRLERDQTQIGWRDSGLTECPMSD